MCFIQKGVPVVLKAGRLGGLGRSNRWIPPKKLENLMMMMIYYYCYYYCYYDWWWWWWCSTRIAYYSAMNMGIHKFELSGRAELGIAGTFGEQFPIDFDRRKDQEPTISETNGQMMCLYKLSILIVSTDSNNIKQLCFLVHRRTIVSWSFETRVVSAFFWRVVGPCWTTFCSQLKSHSLGCADTDICSISTSQMPHHASIKTY